MRQYRTGGYQGPVTVLSRDGGELAHADCRSTSVQDYDGGEAHWSGSLRNVSPHGAISSGPYRLQYPDGVKSDITVRAVEPDSKFIYFVGNGSHLTLLRK